jgi:hypothetical protein
VQLLLLLPVDLAVLKAAKVGPLIAKLRLVGSVVAAPAQAVYDKWAAAAKQSNAVVAAKPAKVNTLSSAESVDPAEDSREKKRARQATAASKGGWCGLITGR